MKKALLYLLLFAYTTIVFKPVFPTIADTVAHIFWYSEHMATVHYENGKYHVHYEYMQAAKKGADEKETSLPKNESVNEHLVIATVYNFTLPPVTQHKFFPSASSFNSIQLNSDFPPPRA